MKGKELTAYDKWLTRRKWRTGEIISPEKAADLYLAEHPLPPAESAEEILDRLYPQFSGKRFLTQDGTYIKWDYAIAAMKDFATLHAQQIADKMVDDMRQKLFSMRATKKTMDMLSEADRLITYGYHDCINEMLMWTKSREDSK